MYSTVTFHQDHVNQTSPWIQMWIGRAEIPPTDSPQGDAASSRRCNGVWKRNIKLILKGDHLGARQKKGSRFNSQSRWGNTTTLDYLHTLKQTSHLSNLTRERKKCHSSEHENMDSRHLFCHNKKWPWWRKIWVKWSGENPGIWDEAGGGVWAGLVWTDPRKYYSNFSDAIVCISSINPGK